MEAANYGRIVMTSSSSGIRGSTLTPGAATQMTEDLLPPKVVELMEQAALTPDLLSLVSDNAPSRGILEATAGGFARTFISESEGIYLAPRAFTRENTVANFEEISNAETAVFYAQDLQQVAKFISEPASALGCR